MVARVEILSGILVESGMPVTIILVVDCILHIKEFIAPIALQTFLRNTVRVFFDFWTLTEMDFFT